MINIKSEMAAVLEKNFGFTAFRPNQEEVIEALISGKDAFIIMPTGGGKSLCYQIPALVKTGTAVIVSPLISLMKDQVDNLISNGIAAAYLNSTLSELESADIIKRLLEGDLKILYVAPERLMMSSTISLLKKTSISLFAIDEAHCVSEWGHDFRPEYRKLTDLKEHFPNTCIAALTATATERVRRDIVHVLQLKDPIIKISSFDRPNLSYQIVEKKDTMEQIEGYLKKNRNKSGIIYCQSRDAVERVAMRLSKSGFSCLPYHAGLSDDKRTKNQERFIHDDVDIIVATVAFGMGIDKPDVRFVIHYDLPKNLESYYQETGRGGRDGLECECILFFNRGDWHKIRYLIEKKPSKKERDLAFQQLAKIVEYCESTECRRNFLLRYFGEIITEPCNNCDSCFHPREKIDGTKEAVLMMECVHQTGQRFGMSHVVDVLCGAKTQKVKEARHDRLKCHGSGKHISKTEWKRIGNELIQSGNLGVSGERYPVVKLTGASRKVMAGEMRIELTEPPISKISKSRTVLPGKEINSDVGAFIEDDDEDDVDDVENDVGDVEYDVGDVEYENIFEEDIMEIDDTFNDAMNGESDDAVNGDEDIINSDDEINSGAVIFTGRKTVLSEISDVRANPIQKVGKTDSQETSAKKFDAVLFEHLRNLRKKIAADKNLPPYVIFADTSLRQMATEFPTDDDAFLDIVGVAEYKLQKYGGLFMNEIADYLRKKAPAVPKQKSIQAELAEKKLAQTHVSKDASGDVSNAVSNTVSNDAANDAANDELKKTQTLFSQGLSVSEISEIRGMPVSKIVDHIEKLILAEKIDNVDFLISEKKQKAISSAMQDLQIEFMSKLMNCAVIEKTDAKCCEEEIRFMKALMIAEMKRKKRAKN
jgi:ATP-dependent DNA helicase RecQ